ncbi:hypothetical protein DM860_003572 [Cuscuta australis]|uniref:Uncharacterized protein n=1 Tax=Cuscuta australis TaxID=267555 RepID=A0A328DLC4_9ASTE|nr:hypothetical protein DM860_003572 [Cuscuta australis]
MDQNDQQIQELTRSDSNSLRLLPSERNAPGTGSRLEVEDDWIVRGLGFLRGHLEWGGVGKNPAVPEVAPCARDQCTERSGPEAATTSRVGRFSGSAVWENWTVVVHCNGD